MPYLIYKNKCNNNIKCMELFKKIDLECLQPMYMCTFSLNCKQLKTPLSTITAMTKVSRLKQLERLLGIGPMSTAHCPPTHWEGCWRRGKEPKDHNFRIEAYSCGCQNQNQLLNSTFITVSPSWEQLIKSSTWPSASIIRITIGIVLCCQRPKSNFCFGGQLHTKETNKKTTWYPV